MAQETVNIGSAPNDGSGDSLRLGGDKINKNFDELYAGVAVLQGTSSGGAPLNGIVTGCGVAYADDLDFDLSAGTYYIDGDLFSADAQSISLDAADPDDPRIDVLYVDDAGLFGKITGTPAASPSQPAVDPTSQLYLTFVFVPAAAATLDEITNETIFDEGTEWPPTVVGAGINATSTNNPFQGTKSIEGTNVAAGSRVSLIRAAPISFDGEGNLVLRIRSKASWNNKRWLTLQWYRAGVAKGGIVNLKSGAFGFDSSITAAYQLVVIPKLAFAVAAGTLVDELRIADVGGSIGFYIDPIILQSTGGATNGGSGGSTAGLTQDQADARYLPKTGGSLTGPLVVPADAYGVDWDGSNEVPTKNDVYDQMQALAASLAGLLDLKSDLDCSTNPNYPAASKGDAYVVSVAGKIGGGSGTSVDVGDVIVAKADNAGGTQAAVGASWFVLEHNLSGVKLAAPNVQAIVSAATATPTFSNDLVKITAQAQALFFANWTGTAVPGWGMGLRIKDDGTARAITYDTKYRAIGVTLPTTTTVGKTTYLGCIYNSDDDKIDVVSVAQEA